MTMIITHFCYLAITIAVTVFVARTLREHGPTFMTEVGEDPTPLLRAKTHLLIVGFYLINLGLISFTLSFGPNALDAKTAIESVSTKIGGIIMAIGLMHFLMMTVFASGRQAGRRGEAGHYTR